MNYNRKNISLKHLLERYSRYNEAVFAMLIHPLTKGALPRSGLTYPSPAKRLPLPITLTEKTLITSLISFPDRVEGSGPNRITIIGARCCDFQVRISSTVTVATCAEVSKSFSESKNKIQGVSQKGL